MKTAVSIPDKLFRRADALARRLKKSRSQVYREALADYVARREAGALTEALDETLAVVGTEVDAWTAEAARAGLERNEW
jgi:predicted transcriptional regulator